MAKPPTSDVTVTDVADLTELTNRTVIAIKTGKKSAMEALGELFAATMAPEVPGPQPVVVTPITDEQKTALKEIVKIYGAVNPVERRILTDDERESITDERTCIDTILKFLAARKDKSIREALANDLDLVAVAEDLVDDDTPLDKNGHYALKQDLKVPGNGAVIQRSKVGGKPVLTEAALFKAVDDGVLDSATYLALTERVPATRRLNEAKMRIAVSKKPELATVLASLMVPTQPTTSITVK